MSFIGAFFGFLNDQLLKMEWLSRLLQLLVEKVFGLNVSTRIGGSVHFFLYESSRSSSCFRC